MADNEKPGCSLPEKQEPTCNELDDFEDSVNMCEVLQEQEDKEAEAMAVLGGSDENNCTYTKGYIKRQALYSCLTCIPDSKNHSEKRAGVCLACSLSCHDGHDLIELYTKRHFRCDCGGDKMKSVTCSLEPTKIDPNEKNTYNQNFSGLYCICERPYPDPEDKIIDEMIQCIVCEDWYHGRHLNADVPECNDFSEMICGKCMDSFPFLSCYLEHSVNANIKKEDVNAVSENPTKKFKISSSCHKKEPMGRELGSAVFWIDGWRMQLCKCDSCLSLYKNEGLQYLLDPEDTVQKYEESGNQRKAKTPASDPISDAISTLGHVHKINLLTQYNSFKERLKEFLQAFAQNNQIVTEEDIKRFFDTMKNEKKTLPILPNSCR